MEAASELQQNVLVRRFILRVLASWIFMMALDLLLNAGVFAKLWLEPSSFLLAPEDLFRRLPLGYIAFLVQAGAYVWLTARIGVRNWKQGSLFGLVLGVMLNMASALGLRSGTTASWAVLAAWLIGGTVLTTGACFMAGFAAERGEKRALLIAFLFLIGTIILVVALQSTGLVPARHMN